MGEIWGIGAEARIGVMQKQGMVMVAGEMGFGLGLRKWASGIWVWAEVKWSDWVSRICN